MKKPMKKKLGRHEKKDLKVGEGFSEARGYIPELGPIPKHNGLNINNEPRGAEQREKEKAERH